jgi:hypothetical protein
MVLAGPDVSLLTGAKAVRDSVAHDTEIGNPGGEWR